MKALRPILLALLAVLLAAAPLFAAGDRGDEAEDETSPTPTPAEAAVKTGAEPNRYDVKPVPDPILAMHIRAGLVATKRPELSALKIRVAGGVVTLTGRVRTRQEKALAEAVARTLPGVRAVDSKIDLAPGNRRLVNHGDSRSLVQMTVDEKTRKKLVRRLTKIAGLRVTDLEIEVIQDVAVIGGVVSSDVYVQRIRHTTTYVNELRGVVLNLTVLEPVP
jgi:osmotically-inducible protein OsmY